MQLSRQMPALRNTLLSYGGGCSLAVWALTVVTYACPVYAAPGIQSTGDRLRGDGHNVYAGHAVIYRSSVSGNKR